jgi:hypothetical protein
MYLNLQLISFDRNSHHYTTPALNTYPQTTPPLLRGAGGDPRSRLDEIIVDLDALEKILR